MNISMTPYASNYSWYSPASATQPSPLKEIAPPNGDISLNPQTDKKNLDQTSQSDLDKSSQADNKPESGESSAQTSPDGSQDRVSTDQASTDQVLTEQEIRLVEELKSRDAEVKAHEMAHIAAGGQYITSGARLSYQKGPDGINYAVGGEVSIDTSPIPGDPEATARKMRQVQQAALAPASPSSQDRKVASRAASQAAKALSELMLLQVKERVSANEDQAFGSQKKAAESYAGIASIPVQPLSRNIDTTA